jgi:F0F1-type ATP synthase delta subunit
MYEKVLSSLKTRDDVEAVEEEIKKISKSLYEGDVNSIQNVLKKDIRNFFSEIVRQETNINDIKSVENYLRILEEKLKAIFDVTIIVAFEPSGYAISKFYDLVQQNIKEKIVLDIEFDPHIIGGAIIIYKGKYKDYSLKTVFNDELNKTQGEILNMLNIQKAKN